MKDFKTVRTRNWAFIMYPDSIPNQSYDIAVRILSDCFLPFAVSPLHDKDFNADGEPKNVPMRLLRLSICIKIFIV